MFRLPSISSSSLRRWLLVAFQTLLAVGSNYGAFWLRFDGWISATHMDQCLHGLPAIVLVRCVCLLLFELDRGLWRYTSLWDLKRVLATVITGTLILYPAIYLGLGVEGYPRSVLIIDSLLLIGVLSGVRILGRLAHEWNQRPGSRRVLIYGAGDAGEMIAREIRTDRDCALEPVGFVDDDPRKAGTSIRGLPILGGRSDLDRIVAKLAPDEILIAMPSASVSQVRSVVAALDRFRLPIKTLPRISRLIERVAADQIRPLALEDLLMRAPVELDVEPVRRFLQGRRVLVTGAGGSIGSELCRQIASFGPERLVMVDKAESALFTIDREIARLLPAERRSACLVNIAVSSRVAGVFERHRPQIVIHAAAYKHVPMMEDHPEEAVLNNVKGTRRLAEESVRHGVETFVLVSTDKAANPTSVMGASKRVCEICIAAIAAAPGMRTRFASVRFGNVLGSNGSVVPIFQDQIARGGPVTVTHPEVRRFFMTIPEAVSLVLRAATIARGGETFVLDMGEQVRIVEVARSLIRVAGYVPDRDIAIEFIGLRPGEKLEEELIADGEEFVTSEEARILQIKANGFHIANVRDRLLALERTAEHADAATVVAALGELVPTLVAELCRPHSALG